MRDKKITGGHSFWNDLRFVMGNGEITEAPPVADKAKRFLGCVPMAGPRMGTGIG